jgi:hypothetical protein
MYFGIFDMLMIITTLLIDGIFVAFSICLLDFYLPCNHFLSPLRFVKFDFNQGQGVRSTTLCEKVC